MSARGAPSLRARRWDVLVVGGALRGLIAATRLAMAGHRVLVVEEEAAARTNPLLREPFAVPGPADGGVLDPCLRALGLAPIERRAFETRRVSHQILAPRVRLEVGSAVDTAEEWVAWGLLKPDEARELARALEAAARAECDAMLAAPLVRAGRGLSLGRRRGPAERSQGAALPAPGPHARGLPEGVGRVPPLLAALFEGQVRALCQTASGRPSPEARARLLGAALTGGGAFHREDQGLRALVRRRLETLHTEFRTVGRGFEFLRVGDHPGIAGMTPGDAWLGRVVLVNAPPARLAAALEGWGFDPPDFLTGPVPTHRRLAIHLRAVAEAVPEGLARRAVLLSSDRDPAGAVALSLHASPRGSRFAELVARRVVPAGVDTEAEAFALEKAVVDLMPFSEGRLARAPLAPAPLWDDEWALADPSRGHDWPGELTLRDGRLPVYVLPPEALGSLGAEGDLLVGWRAGDAMRAELS